MRTIPMLLAAGVITAYVVAGIFSIGNSRDMKLAMATAGAPPHLAPEGTVPLGMIVTGAGRDAAGKPVIEPNSRVVMLFGRPNTPAPTPR